MIFFRIFANSFNTDTRMTANAPAAGFADTKPHYEILDGLRGVAALMVVWYHICE